MSDQTQVALDLAGKVVVEVGSFMNAIEEFQAIYDWRVGAGIDFANFETEIAGQSSLKHTEGGALQKVSGAVQLGIVAYLQATTLVGGPLEGKTYWEALQMIRRA